MTLVLYAIFSVFYDRAERAKNFLLKSSVYICETFLTS